MNPSDDLPDTIAYKKYLNGDYDNIETIALKYIGFCFKIALISGFIAFILKKI